MRTAEEIRTYKHAWYMAHQEEMKARAREWYRGNPVRAKARMAAYRATHPEAVAAAHRAWLETNLDAKRRTDRNYGRAHAEELRKKNLGRQQARHDRRTAYRARKGAAHGRHTREEWALVRDGYHGLCVYCHAPSDRKDHVTPLSRGGSNDIENIVPACRSCNSRKHRMPLLVWLAVRQGAMERTQ